MTVYGITICYDYEVHSIKKRISHYLENQRLLSEVSSVVIEHVVREVTHIDLYTKSEKCTMVCGKQRPTLPVDNLCFSCGREFFVMEFVMPLVRCVRYERGTRCYNCYYGEEVAQMGFLIHCLSIEWLVRDICRNITSIYNNLRKELMSYGYPPPILNLPSLPLPLPISNGQMITMYSQRKVHYFTITPLFSVFRWVSCVIERIPYPSYGVEKMVPVDEHSFQNIEQCLLHIDSVRKKEYLF